MGFGGGKGAYCIMMAFYVQVIWKRGLARNRLIASATIALFLLCSAHCILVIAVATADSLGFRQLAIELLDDEIPPQSPLTDLSVAAHTAYVTANIPADSIFIYRCYAIWNFQKKI
ncbi:hypothetical protein GGX14DRAFT_546422, partial [Mycena pura]